VQSDETSTKLAAVLQVSLIGFEGERCVDGVENNQNITKCLLTNPFSSWPRSLFVLWAPLKVLYQVSAA